MHMFNVSTLCRQSVELFHQKALVQVDWPIKALSMHTYTNKPEKNVKVLIAATLSIILFWKPNSFMHMFNVSVLCRQSIKMFYQKL